METGEILHHRRAGSGAPRRAWALVAGVFVALLLLVGVGLVAYVRAATQVVAYPVSIPKLPKPNAYDDYVEAGKLARAGRDAQVSLAVSPASGSVGAVRPPVRLAYEDGVPLSALRQTVTRHRATLARLRGGFRHEFANPPVLSFGQMLPELADFRALARVLLSEGKLAEREGRPTDAVRSYLDCVRLGTDVGRGGPLIHHHVGLAVQLMGLKALDGMVTQVDEQTARAAIRRMESLDREAPTYREALELEKEARTACFVDLFSSGTSPDRLMQLWGVRSEGAWHDNIRRVEYAFTPKASVVEAHRSYLDAAIAAADKPFHQAGALPSPSDRVSRELSFMEGLYPDGRFHWAHRDACWRIVQGRFAIRAYELRRGGPPPTLKALVPVYLPSEPADPFAPQPLVYRSKDRAVFLYSRGPDGDDDGGSDLGAEAKSTSAGDIVNVK